MWRTNWPLTFLYFKIVKKKKTFPLRQRDYYDCVNELIFQKWVGFASLKLVWLKNSTSNVQLINRLRNICQLWGNLLFVCKIILLFSKLLTCTIALLLYKL